MCEVPLLKFHRSCLQLISVRCLYWTTKMALCKILHVNWCLYLLAANYLSVMWSQNTQKMSQSFKWWWTRPWPLWMTLNGDLDCDFRSHREKPKSMTRWYLRDPRWQSRDYGPLIVFREAGELKSIQISRCSHWRTFVVFATSLLCTQGHKEGSFL